MQAVIPIVLEEIVGDTIQSELPIGHSVSYSPHSCTEVRVVIAKVT